MLDLLRCRRLSVGTPGYTAPAPAAPAPRVSNRLSSSNMERTKHIHTHGRLHGHDHLLNDGPSLVFCRNSVQPSSYTLPPQKPNGLYC